MESTAGRQRSARRGPPLERECSLVSSWCGARPYILPRLPPQAEGVKRAAGQKNQKYHKPSEGRVTGERGAVGREDIGRRLERERPEVQQTDEEKTAACKESPEAGSGAPAQVEVEAERDHGIETKAV